MNISATNCTPIKPQSFGMSANIDDAQRVIDLSKQLNDSFKKEGEDKKNPIQTAASVVGAFAATFIVGRAGASKVLTAFPELPAKVAKYAKAILAKVKSVKFPEGLVNKAKNFADKPFVKSIISKVSDVASKAVNFGKKYVEEHGAENVIKNAAGVVSMAVLGSQVATVDGNGDGIADIAQKNVNAYKNAVYSAGIVGEMVEALS